MTYLLIINMLNLLFFVLGIMLGMIAAFFYRSLTAAPEPVHKEQVVDNDAEDWSDEESDDDQQMMSDIKFLEAKGYDDVMAEKYPPNDVKMVLATRNDLGMGKGKIGAQCGHATLGSYSQAKRWGAKSNYWKNILKTWSVIGQKKICVKVNSEQEM